MATLVYDDFVPDTPGVTEDLVDHTPATVAVPGAVWKNETATSKLRVDSGFEALRLWDDNRTGRIDTGESDHKITANFTSDVPNGGSANDVFLQTRKDNVESASNCYEFRLQPSNDTVSLYAYVSGTPTQVGSDAAFSFNNNADYEVFVSSIGSDHVLKINGTTYISETDSSAPSNTYVGLGSKTLSANGRPAFYSILVEDITAPGSNQSFPTSVLENEDTAWSASDTTIVGDLSDSDPATYATSSAVGETLRVLMGTLTAPGANGAELRITYSAAVGLPEIPLNASATPASETSLDLAWDSVSSATGYRVYNTSPSVPSDTLLIDQAGTTYTHTGLSAWELRHYRVSAYNATGEGEKSVPFSGRTEDNTSPSDVVINSIAVLGNVLTFDIVKSTDAASGVSSNYQLYEGASLYTILEVPSFDEDTGDELPIEITIPQSAGVTRDWKFITQDAAGNFSGFSNVVQTTGRPVFAVYGGGF